MPPRRAPFTVPRVIAAIDDIQRFIPPESLADQTLLTVVSAVKRYRGRSIAKRPGVLSGLRAAHQQSTDPVVRTELTHLIARIEGA